MSMIDLIFSWLTSIYLLHTMNPRNLLVATPNTHFLGLSFIPYFFRPFSAFNYYVIYIKLHISPNLLSEHFIDQPLKCFPGIVFSLKGLIL